MPTSAPNFESLKLARTVFRLSFLKEFSHGFTRFFPQILFGVKKSPQFSTDTLSENGIVSGFLLAFRNTPAGFSLLYQNGLANECHISEVFPRLLNLNKTHVDHLSLVSWSLD